MNNINFTMLRNIISTFVAVAVLALMGIGEVQAQPVGAGSDDATVEASINVFNNVQITADNENLNFGNVTPGAGAQSVDPGAGASFTVSGTSLSAAEGIDIQVSWGTPTDFTGDWSWTPTVTSGDQSATGNGQSITISGIGNDGDGTAQVQVGGETEAVPTDISGGTYTSSLTLTAEYTSL